MSTNSCLTPQGVDLKWLEEKLPYIPVELLDDVVQMVHRHGVEAVGIFYSGIIQLVRNSPKGTEYREAFHAVFNSYLSEDQRNKILDEASKKYGIKRSKETIYEIDENAVYEALGFKKSEIIKAAEERKEEIEQAFNDYESTFVYYGDEDMIDSESNRINPIDTVELSKEYRNKGIGTLKYILEGEKNLEKGMFMTSDPTKRVSQQADNIWKKLIKFGLAEIRNGRYYYTGNKITPQQKQQATFLFSDFLDVYLQDYEQVEKILKQENIIQKKCS